MRFMNKSEEKGYNWLLKQGIPKELIRYQPRGNPDFLTPNGGFEIKTLTRQGNRGYITFSGDSQLKELEVLNAKVLVFSHENEEPFLMGSVEEVKEKLKHLFFPPNEDVRKRTEVSSQGRITLPKNIREKLKISRGTILEVTIYKNKILLEILVP